MNWVTRVLNFFSIGKDKHDHWRAPSTTMAATTTAAHRACFTIRARASPRKTRRHVLAGQGPPGGKGANEGAVEPRRRDLVAALLASVAGSATTTTSGPASAAAAATADTGDAAETLTRLQREAAAAYDAQNFDKAFGALSQLRRLEPDNPNWVEACAQVGVDAKRFEESIALYTSLLESIDSTKDGGSAARFRAGRALAYEGLYAWPLALKVRGAREGAGGQNETGGNRFFFLGGGRFGSADKDERMADECEGTEG